MPSDHSPASFFKFKHEPEATNDSCNVLFDTNHFWLLQTLDNLEYAASRWAGEILGNEQLRLLADESPLLTRQWHVCWLPNRSAFQWGKSVGDWMGVHLISEQPEQASECLKMLARQQTFPCGKLTVEAPLHRSTSSFSSKLALLLLCDKGEVGALENFIGFAQRSNMLLWSRSRRKVPWFQSQCWEVKGLFKA